MMIERLAKTDPLIKAIMPMLIKRIVAGNNMVLSDQNSIDGLVETARAIYKNIQSTLPAQKKRSLENAVLPKMEEFMKAVRDFRKSYED